MAFGLTAWPTVDQASQLKINYNDSGVGVGLQYFPMNTRDQTDSETVKFKVLGQSLGMTQGSLLGAPAKLITRPKVELRAIQTTYWKDAAEIGEEDIIRLASIKSGQDRKRSGLEQWMIARWQLLTRLKRRVEWTIWQACENAWASGVQVGEQFIKIDYGLTGATTLTTLWTDYSNSDPIKDFRGLLVSLRGQGIHYVDVVMNQKTANDMCQSAKLKDMFAGSPLFYTLNPGDLNGPIKDMIQRGDNGSGCIQIRKFVVNDGNYPDDSGTTQLYIPDGRVHIIGGRYDAKAMSDDSPFSIPDTLVGEWMSTPAIHGRGGGSSDLADVRPGIFISTTDKTDDNPKRVELIGGIHGVPVIYHPNWLVRWQVQ